MIVLIAGMQRSGSTFSFNVARKLLEARGSFYDTRTFFHRRRVTSLKSRSAEEQLTGAELAAVRNSLTAYTDSQGNYHWRGAKWA